jgi:hypothetical protein
MIRNKYLLAFLFTLSASAVIAQPPAGDQPPPGKDGPQGDRQHRPPPPIIAALDTDKDGTISATEIDSAPDSLKKLDKNGDGKLTMDELRPPRPDGDNQKGPGDNQQPPKNNKPGAGKDGPKGGGGQRKGPAQDAPPGGKQTPSPDGSGQGGPQGGKRPAPPIIAALDTDKDGVISADEIANASASLRTLDKNGDGQLTPDEYRPEPPKRDGNKGGGPQGPNDKGGGGADKRPPKD